MLVLTRLTRKRNESIRIGDHINVVIVDVRGDKVRLGIEVPRGLPVHRSEVYEALHATDGPATPSEFVPDPRPTGDAEHFVREGLWAMDVYSGCPIAANLALALDKFRKALAILTHREPPVVHP